MSSKDDTIKRTEKSPGVPSYFRAIQKILKLQRGILTGVLPHYGERGRNDEQRLINFLKQILPQRFGIGTGFIVSSDLQAESSNQTDIIISDELYNSTLHRELAAQVFPIETIYATIEVKGTLSKHKRSRGKTDFDQVLENISKIRHVAKEKHYVEYASEPKNEQKPDELVARKYSFSNTLPPRGYLFAYHTDDWSEIDDFVASLQAALLKHKEAHIHGAIVLDKNWFAKQEPYTDERRELIAYDDDCLLRFTNSLLHGIQSMPMGMIDLDRYYAPLDQKLPVVDTEDSSFCGIIDVALPVLVMLLVLNLLLLVLLIFFPKNIKDIFNSSNSLSFGSFS